MVTVSSKAAEEFKRLLTEKELPATTRVRVGVELVPEQQERVRLSLGFDAKPAGNTDETQFSEGIEVVMQKELVQYLGDAQIHFVMQEGEQGHFVFRRAEE